jgi:hypothetical protein
VKAALVVVVALVGGCAETQYPPQVVARGELTLRYHGAYEMWGGGRRVARGLGWAGLTEYVGCVPAARAHAMAARSAGRAALGLSIAGGVIGGAALGGLIGLVDTDHQWQWLGGGLAMAAAGVVLAGIGRMERNAANGHAVDAMNHYNDAVGALGATCDDLTYPPPTGALSPPLPPPTPPTATPPPTMSSPTTPPPTMSSPTTPPPTTPPP